MTTGGEWTSYSYIEKVSWRLLTLTDRVILSLDLGYFGSRLLNISRVLSPHYGLVAG